MLAASGSTLIWVCVVAGTLLVGVLSAVLLRRRRNLWAGFAHHHGLAFQQLGHGQLRVSGRLHRRPFELSTLAGSSDDGTLGVREVRMSLGLSQPPPAGLEVIRAGGVIGKLQRAAESTPPPTGDPSFDEQTVVTADDPQAAEAWLTQSRRRAIREFFDALGPGEAGVKADGLWVSDREMLTSRERIEGRVSMLSEAAQRLDSAAG